MMIHAPRVVAEPRADNAKMIGHMHNQCFHCEKEFDFPHKRAALMILGRERFFDRCRRLAPEVRSASVLR